MNTLMPEVSAWYQELASGNLFEVVAIDEASGSIEYQLLDGEVGEYDSASWQMLYLAPTEAPEDWRSPYALSTEDRAYSDQTTVPEDFSGPLTEPEPELMDFGDDFQIL
ncbi:MAG TPA: hypothetical protein DCR00_10940 [Gammaproteobacteria bacterium]|nr:hypothetical protein [Gammaproteobacteria bacterium]